VAQRVGRGVALLFHDLGTRREWVVSSTPWPHFTLGKDAIPIVHSNAHKVIAGFFLSPDPEVT
jgi:hypothetical protein